MDSNGREQTVLVKKSEERFLQKRAFKNKNTNRQGLKRSQTRCPLSGNENVLSGQKKPFTIPARSFFTRFFFRVCSLLLFPQPRRGVCICVFMAAVDRHEPRGAGVLR